MQAEELHRGCSLADAGDAGETPWRERTFLPGALNH